MPICTMLEEAERRDHRRIGKEMDLFHLQEEAAGSCSGTPRAGSCIAPSEDYMRRRLDAGGYQEVKTPQLVDRALVGKLGPLGKIPRAHVHRPGGGRGQDAGAEADELPLPHPDLPPGHALLSRTAAAAGGVRLLPPLRTLRRAARHHAGARVHPGRRAYLLHGSSRSPRRRCGSSNCCRSIYRDFGFAEFRVKFSDRPADARRLRRGVGPCRGRAEGSLRHGRCRLRR